MKTVSLAVFLFVSLTLLSQFSLGEGKDRDKHKSCKGTTGDHCNGDSKIREERAEKYKKERQGKYHKDDDDDDDDDYDDDDDDENYGNIDRNMRKKDVRRDADLLTKGDGSEAIENGVGGKAIENGVGGKHERKWVGRKKEYEEKKKHDKITKGSKEKGDFQNKEGERKQAKNGREERPTADGNKADKKKAREEKVADGNKADEKKAREEKINGVSRKNLKPTDSKNEDKASKNSRKKRSVNDPYVEGKDEESTITENGTGEHVNNEEAPISEANDGNYENKASLDQPTGDATVEGSEGDITSDSGSESEEMKPKTGEENLGGEQEGPDENLDKTTTDKPLEEKEASEELAAGDHPEAYIPTAGDHPEAYIPTEEGADAEADGEGPVATEEGEDFTRSRWASATYSPRDELPHVTLEFDSREMLPEHMWVGKSSDESEGGVDGEAGLSGGRGVEVEVSDGREGGGEVGGGGEGVEGGEVGVREGVEGGEGEGEGIEGEGEAEGVNGKDRGETLKETVDINHTQLEPDEVVESDAL